MLCSVLMTIRENDGRGNDDRGKDVVPLTKCKDLQTKTFLVFNREVGGGEDF